MNTPKVSVLIPSYNYANYIGEAIESVLAQTFTDYELIIVDSASTDNTDEVVKKYLPDPRISYFKENTNLGLVGNWNRSLNYVNGEYIKFLCADDKFDPLLLEQFVTAMDKHESVSIVTSYRKVFGGSSKILTFPLQHFQSGRNMIHSYIHTYKRLGEPTSIMFRKADLEKVGKFNPERFQFVDADLWMRLLTIGDCYVIPEPLSHQRSHPDAITSENFRTKRFTFEDYEFHRDLRDGKIINIDWSGMNIDKSVKGKAVLCAKVMYQMLPQLSKKESRATFKRAFGIAVKEGVMLRPIVDYVKRKTTIRFS